MANAFLFKKAKRMFRDRESLLNGEAVDFFMEKIWKLDSESRSYGEKAAISVSSTIYWIHLHSILKKKSVKIESPILVLNMMEKKREEIKPVWLSPKDVQMFRDIQSSPFNFNKNYLFIENRKIRTFDPVVLFNHSKLEELHTAISCSSSLEVVVNELVELKYKERKVVMGKWSKAWQLKRDALSYVLGIIKTSNKEGKELREKMLILSHRMNLKGCEELFLEAKNSVPTDKDELASRKRTLLSMKTNMATAITNLKERGHIETWDKLYQIKPVREASVFYKDYAKFKRSDGWCWYSDIAKNSWGTGDGMRYGPMLVRHIYSGNIDVRRRADKTGRVKREFKVIRKTAKRTCIPKITSVQLVK